MSAAMIALSRAENWPVLLDSWVDEHRARTFAWREWDCCSAALDWVRVCTGADVFADFFAQADAPEAYADASSAMRILQGAGGIKPLMDVVLGNPINAVFAQRGDVVLVDIEGRESLAVCLGSIAAGPGEGGMAFTARGGWPCAWRI